MAGLLYPVSGPITSPYGHRHGVNPLAASDFHTGIDFGVPVGTPIYATHSGYFTTETQYAGGLMLHVRAPDGSWQTTYAHTSRAAVQAGAFVRAGDLIGYSGRSGAAVTGAHLHYEVRRNGQLVDPRYVAPNDPVKGYFPGAFRYDSVTAAQQQRRQLSEIERVKAEQQEHELVQARGILGEFSQIARSQRPRNYGIDRIARQARATAGRRTRESRFAV